jgi:hypothetical protein
MNFGKNKGKFSEHTFLKTFHKQHVANCFGSGSNVAERNEIAFHRCGAARFRFSVKVKPINGTLKRPQMQDKCHC